MLLTRDISREVGAYPQRLPLAHAAPVQKENRGDRSPRDALKRVLDYCGFCGEPPSVLAGVPTGLGVTISVTGTCTPVPGTCTGWNA